MNIKKRPYVKNAEVAKPVVQAQTPHCDSDCQVLIQYEDGKPKAIVGMEHSERCKKGQG